MPDPGAVNKEGVKEGDLNIEFRDMVSRELSLRGAAHIKDRDNESLGAYLRRVKTGSGSVILEYHFDAALSQAATGTTALVRTGADADERRFAAELAESTSRILGIRNRGVKDERQSNRGTLALVRKAGIACLLELGFITNPSDVAAYHKNKHALAKEHANILIEFENLRS